MTTSEANKPFLSGTAQDQPAKPEQLRTLKVLLFLAQGFEDAEAAAVKDVFGWTAYRASVATVEVVTTGLHERMTGAFGTSYAADIALADVDAANYDALIIPGGFHNFGFDEAYCDEVYALARAFRETGKPIGSMCVGILPVAQAGALTDECATTYRFSRRHDNAGVLASAGAHVVDEAVVESNGIISCAGPAQSDEVCMRVLALIAGEEAAHEVARYRTGIDC